MYIWPANGCLSVRHADAEIKAPPHPTPVGNAELTKVISCLFVCLFNLGEGQNTAMHASPTAEMSPLYFQPSRFIECCCFFFFFSFFRVLSQLVTALIAAVANVVLVEGHVELPS